MPLQQWAWGQGTIVQGGVCWSVFAGTWIVMVGTRYSVLGTRHSEESMPQTRVVVIEDEPAIRRGVVDALRAMSYQVAEAADGATGLEEALRRGVDLVLLD